MKSFNFFLYATVLFFTAQSIAPNLIFNNKLLGRAPASFGPTNEIAAPKDYEVGCKSELKGEKLQADMKKLINDKEEIIKKATPEKTEKTEKSEKKLSTNETKTDNSDLLALLGQMTTLISNQMQMQMDMQNQMMNMLSQMQMPSYMTNFSPDSNNFINRNPMQYSSPNLEHYGIGTPSQMTSWSNYPNPYFQPQYNSWNNQMPFLNSPFNDRPRTVSGFDFSNDPAPIPPEQIQRQQIETASSFI